MIDDKESERLFRQLADALRNSGMGWVVDGCSAAATARKRNPRRRAKQENQGMYSRRGSRRCVLLDRV